MTPHLKIVNGLWLPRLLFAAWTCLTLLSVQPAAAGADAEKHMQGVIDRGFAILQDNSGGETARKARFHDFVVENIDTEKTGLFADFVLRPVLWCFQKLFAITASIQSPFMQAGVRIAAWLYLAGAVLFLIYWVTVIFTFCRSIDTCDKVLGCSVKWPLHIEAEPMRWIMKLGCRSPC